MKGAWGVRFVLLLSCVFATSTARAAGYASQARDEHESWLEAQLRVEEKMFRENPGGVSDLALSARGAATSMQRLDLSGMPEWSEAATTAAFEEMRELRFLYLPERPRFLRRISWLYPDDGCFARAAYAGKRAAARDLARPHKLFVFGDLSVRTRNAPGGRAFWWYHVASIVSVAGLPMVLDPAVEPLSPLPFEDWIRRLTREPRQALYAHCSPYSYAHYSICQDAPASAEADAPSDEGEFLRLEWNRMIELGRDPSRILGDDPPWRSALNRRSDLQGQAGVEGADLAVGNREARVPAKSETYARGKPAARDVAGIARCGGVRAAGEGIAELTKDAAGLKSE